MKRRTPCAPRGFGRRAGALRGAAALALSLAAGTLPAAAEPATPAAIARDGDFLTPRGEGPFPAVVLMHGCGGLSPGVRAGLEAHAAYLAEHGFASLIIDSFAPRGLAGGRVCRSLDLLARARAYRVQDALAARDRLADLPEIDPARIFLIGQSNGGSVALRLAGHPRNRPGPGAPAFAAVAAYYPWCGPLAAFTPAVPTLILAAGADDWVSAAQCRRQAARLPARAAPVEVVVHEGALHSFDLPIPAQTYAGHRVGGDAEATARSRRAYLDFFRRHGPPADGP